MIYYEECHDRLPKIAKKYAEQTDDFSTDIFDVPKPGEILLNTHGYVNYSDSDIDGKEVDVDPRIPVVPKKLVSKGDGVVTLQNSQRKITKENNMHSDDDRHEEYLIPKKSLAATKPYADGSSNNMIPKKIVVNCTPSTASSHIDAKDRKLSPSGIDNPPPYSRESALVTTAKRNIDIGHRRYNERHKN